MLTFDRICIGISPGRLRLADNIDQLQAEKTSWVGRTVA
jgi:hypothetical protein